MIRKRAIERETQPRLSLESVSSAVQNSNGYPVLFSIFIHTIYIFFFSILLLLFLSFSQMVADAASVVSG